MLFSKKIKRILCIVLAVLFCMPALASCGENGEASSESPESKGESTAESTEESKEEESKEPEIKAILPERIPISSSLSATARPL